ncbi:hypothetical protein [Paenibacillus daejeonensis]|nr:hypothetical protein [Paenibacillus daejeonensis]
MYEEIQAWLVENGYDEQPRSFDFEHWIGQTGTELATTRIVIYIPI